MTPLSTTKHWRYRLLSHKSVWDSLEVKGFGIFAEKGSNGNTAQVLFGSQVSVVGRQQPLGFLWHREAQKAHLEGVFERHVIWAHYR